MSRILHVITSLQLGGAERLMVDLLPRLRDMGHEVELAVFDGRETPLFAPLEQAGITIHRLATGRNVYDPRNIFDLARLLRRGHYDIVHTHNTACQLFAPFARTLSGQKTRLFTTEHSPSNHRRNKVFLRYIDKWMYARYNRIICISEQTRTNLEQHIGKQSKTSVVHNGIDVARFTKPIKDITGQTQLQIVMVAGFRYEKDQDTLLRAMAQLPGNYRLRLVGDGARRAELENLAQTLGITARVDFAGVRSDIPDVLAEADVVVLSSHYEGLSLASVEGMASGRPFIASDVEGLREVVGGYGLLFPHGDAIALAETILEITKSPAYYREITTRCRTRAAEYDISRMVEGYDSIYSK